MWIFSILYIICIIAAITIYFRACNTFDKYERNNQETEYLNSIKKFKTSLIVLIIGFIILTVELITRLILY